MKAETPASASPALSTSTALRGGGRIPSAATRREGVYLTSAHLRYANRVHRAKHAKRLQHVDDDRDDRHHGDDLLDPGIHRDVGLDQPEEHADDDEDDDEGDQRHREQSSTGILVQEERQRQPSPKIENFENLQNG